MTRSTRFSLTATQLWKGAVAVALAVLAIAAILPNILPRKFTIATQTYVDESVDGARAAGVAAEERMASRVSDVASEVGVIKVKVGAVETVQNQSRAAQEADRVTRHLRSGDDRVREYQRIYESGLRNLRSDPQREPLDGVRLP